MRGEIRRWFWLFFASGEIRHWQISPLDNEAVSTQRSILAPVAIPGYNPVLFQGVQMVPDGFLALACVFSQLSHRREAGPRLIGIVGKGHQNELAPARLHDSF